MTISIPPSLTGTPAYATVRVGTPTTSATASALVGNALHLAGLRMRHGTTHSVGYNIAAGDIRTQSPLGVTFGTSTIWRTSPRAAHVWFWARYQSAIDSGGAQQAISVSLHRLSDGALIDSGVVMGVANLEADAVGDNYEPRIITSGFRLDPAAGAAPTAPRLLNLGSTPGGTFVELRASTIDTRLIEIGAWDVALRELDQAP